MFKFKKQIHFVMTETPLETVAVYREHIIEINWSSGTECYFWEVYKGSQRIGDNSKGYGCDKTEEAMRDAMLHIDWVVDDCEDDE